MSESTLKNRVRRRIASAPSADLQDENSVAVVVRGGTIPWVLRFWGRFGDDLAYAGAVRIFPAKFARVVAICSMPGARQWEVEGRGATDAVDEIAVHFEGIEAKGGPFGVQPVAGVSVAGGRSYRVATGTNGNIVITGEVFGWAAWATAAAATVQAVANPALTDFAPIALPVPAGGAVQGNAMGLLAPISTWTFTNTAAFMIEYVPPGIVFDG